jgi:hypothetical protein
MKKTLFTLVLAALCLPVFTSCDPQDLSDILSSDALGTITLTTSQAANGEQLYGNDSTITFKSGLCNVNHRDIHIDIDTLNVDYDTTLLNVNAGAIYIGVNGVNVMENTANIDWPLFGMNLRDTVVGNYFFFLPVQTFAFLNYLDTSSINSLVATGLTFQSMPFNLFAVAASKDEYYIGYSGSVSVNNFGPDGTMIEGTFNNVKAYYVTTTKLREMIDLGAEEWNTRTLASELPTITFNGTFTSRRANMTSVINRVNELDEVEVTK